MALISLAVDIGGGVCSRPAFFSRAAFNRGI